MLNNNVSDVLYSDTAVYENMVRLVKLLSYSPDGYHGARAPFQISVNQDQAGAGGLASSIYIPKYATVKG